MVIRDGSRLVIGLVIGCGHYLNTRQINKETTSIPQTKFGDVALNRVTTIFQQIYARLEIEDFRVHDLRAIRHTAAS
ncbi:MAG TPA: hypothetical protein PKC13_20625 [Blastocatellia bacterium]|nr:hypothetical protein [Blastocatellia bacterium]